MAATTYTTTTQYLKPQTEVFEPVQCVKGDPKDTVPVPYHECLENISHTVLQVQEPVSSGPKHFTVNVFNGSNGKKIPVKVRSTDTIGKLQQKLWKVSPDLRKNLNLVFNGRIVFVKQTLCELQVKPGATFTTYFKCVGG